MKYIFDVFEVLLAISLLILVVPQEQWAFGIFLIVMISRKK